MAEVKYLDYTGLSEYDALIKAEIESGLAGKSDTSHTHSAATTSAAGLMSASDKTKLNGIAAGAQVNQNAFSNVVVGSTTIAADSTTDSLTLTAGSNITLTPDSTNDGVTIAATNTDTKVTNTLAATTKAYVTGTTSSSTNTGTQVFDTGVYLDTAAGKLTATTFSGTLSGNATSATKLATARTLTTNLASTTSASFNGTANASIGVTGTLPVANGGTGATTALAGLNNLANRGTVGSTTDWDTLTTGYWIVGQSTSFSSDYNQPVGAYTWGTLYVTNNGSNISQIYIAHSNGQMWFRDRFSSSYTFTSWARTYTTLTKPTLTDLGLTATATELNYMDGVTSNVQTQLNNKAASSHTHSYLPLSGGTMTGAVTNGTTSGGSWITGKTGTPKILDLTTASTMDGSRYDPLVRGKNTDGDVWNFGMGASNQFGFFGFKKDRTNNGIDWSATFNITSGAFSTTGSVTASGGFTGATFSGSGASLTSLNASNISSGTLAAARLATSGVTAGSYGPTANVSGSNGTTILVPQITVDTYGRVTSVTNRTYTSVNTDTNTDTKVTQTVTTTNANYPLLLAPSGQTATTTTSGYFGTKFQANPNTGVLTATTFSGALSGNASSATYATCARIIDTEPTSSTTYYPTWTTGKTASVDYSLRANDGFKYVTLEGTTSAAGYGRIYLGNATASGTAGNKYGGLLMYGTDAYYWFISGAKAAAANRTIYMPNSSGSLVTATNATAVGGTAKPVYVSSAGAVTACSSTVGSATKPVYMSSGTITASSSTVGSATKPVYMSSGTITACSSTVGNTAQPIYSNAGTLTGITSVGVAYGGTGATTAAGALANLGLTATAAELNIMDGVTATTAELNYCDGVTSNIQTQLNNKLPLSGGTITISSLGALNILRSGSTNGAAIKFSNSNGTLGYVGMTGSANGGLRRYSADTNSSYTILDSSNYASYMLSKVYPVGSVYISYASTSPASFLGGTWTALTGVFPYFNAGTGTGGSNTHTLTAAQMPSHRHELNESVMYYNTTYGNTSTTGGSNMGGYQYLRNQGMDAQYGGYNGSGSSHNNMPAYQTLYAWRRTA